MAGEARGIGKAREANQLAAARVRIVPAPVEAVPTADVVVMIVAVRVVAAIVMAGVVVMIVAVRVVVMIVAVRVVAAIVMAVMIVEPRVVAASVMAGVVVTIVAVRVAGVVVMIVAVRVVAVIVADHAPGEVSTTMRRPRRQVQSRGVGWPAKEQLDCGTTRGMTAMNATQATT